MLAVPMAATSEPPTLAVRVPSWVASAVPWGPVASQEPDSRHNGSAVLLRAQLNQVQPAVLTPWTRFEPRRGRTRRHRDTALA